MEKICELNRLANLDGKGRSDMDLTCVQEAQVAQLGGPQSILLTVVLPECAGPQVLEAERITAGSRVLRCPLAKGHLQQSSLAVLPRRDLWAQRQRAGSGAAMENISPTAQHRPARESWTWRGYRPFSGVFKPCGQVRRAG